MRASTQEQTGGAGVSEVCAAFERIGWGTTENSRHDLGTDLFVAARDERRFDLGLVVGVQVKTGDSWFKAPRRDGDGLVDGWWFRDRNRAHVDSWAAHGLPHLLVLHDLTTTTSYWAHVTHEAIVSTGTGAKVLVPSTQTIDAGNRQALIDVAASPGSGVIWEGSAWTMNILLAPRDVLRHALTVPRLVAPHPNAGHLAPLTPGQAVAVLVQGRLHDLHRFATAQSDVPSLTEMMDSPLWAWRFVGALTRWVTVEDIEGLLVQRSRSLLYM